MKIEFLILTAFIHSLDSVQVQLGEYFGNGLWGPDRVVSLWLHQPLNVALATHVVLSDSNVTNGGDGLGNYGSDIVAEVLRILISKRMVFDGKFQLLVRIIVVIVETRSN